MTIQIEKINNKPSEKKIVRAVLNLFRRKGINFLFTEVQFCERRVDILCLNEKTKRFFAVEAKVNAPYKAFIQAERYKYIADYVYVAILKNGSNKTALELSKNTGIGLIFVKRDSLDRYKAEIAISPEMSKYKDIKIANYIWTVNTKNKRTP